MADAADAAGDEQELIADLLLQQHRRAAAQHREVMSAGTGECLNCEAPLETGRYCDVDCRMDHERRVMSRLRR
jgi:hypothetical protein